MKKIKTCPFCNGTDITTDYPDVFFVCNTCEAYWPTAKTKEDALRLWNSRPGENQLGYEEDAYLLTK